MEPDLQKFGSDWTQDKLDRVHKYLSAYTKILSGKYYKIVYIDAFAGTGYRELKEVQDSSLPLFPEIETVEVQNFLDGSARIALQVEPQFNEYIFIEKDVTKVRELEKLQSEFQALDIKVVCAEANVHLQKLCSEGDWSKQRAVIFLDPFAMQVSWTTMQAIARTHAIDTWILFPISAVNRLLKRNGEIPKSWRKKLDAMFGETDWYFEFFPKQKAPLLLKL